MPKGTPIKDAIKTAINDIFNEVVTTYKRLASKFIISFREELIASIKKLFFLFS